jgi:DNA (cytosine-5)-methyltransferase 1
MIYYVRVFRVNRSLLREREKVSIPRSNVFWKILEIVQHHNPSILLLENVKNLKTHDGGKTFATISSSLSNLGYHIKYDVLDTSRITHVPHHRERIYIVAFRDKDIYDQFQFNFNAVENKPISNFLEKTIPSKYYYTSKLQVFPVIQASVTKSVLTTNTIYQYRRHYVRENKKNQCPTLTANMGAGGHNVPLILDTKGIRKLTPRECFNLQGFPTDYILPDISDSSLYKLAGNAVSVPVVELIVNTLIECM